MDEVGHLVLGLGLEPRGVVARGELRGGLHQVTDGPRDGSRQYGCGHGQLADERDRRQHDHFPHARERPGDLPLLDHQRHGDDDLARGIPQLAHRRVGHRDLARSDRHGDDQVGQPLVNEQPLDLSVEPRRK